MSRLRWHGNSNQNECWVQTGAGDYVIRQQKDDRFSIVFYGWRYKRRFKKVGSTLEEAQRIVQADARP